MSSASHRSILLDHKLVIEEVIFHEHKELETNINEEGIQESILSHTRAIGDRQYVVSQRNIRGEVLEETNETKTKVANFHK